MGILSEGNEKVIVFKLPSFLTLLLAFISLELTLWSLFVILALLLLFCFYTMRTTGHYNEQEQGLGLT